MKANNGSGNIPERDEWETPKELFNSLNKQYHFDFDCCAIGFNRKVAYYTDKFEKFEFREIKGTGWMNPPFSKAKKMFEQFFYVLVRGVAIYRCDNLETKIWQDVIFKNADWIFIPKGRVKYEGINGNGSRFPSALIGIGVDPPKYVDGICLKLNIHGNSDQPNER